LGMGRRKETKAGGNRAWKIWLPALAWLALIFIGSSISLPSSTISVFRFQDKVVHLVEYGILGLLLIRPVHRLRPGRPDLYWLCIAGAGLYGILDEFHQYFVPGRSVEAGDALSDAAGAFIAVWLYLKSKGAGLFRKVGSPR
jgi:VanZ family protein